MENRNNLIWAVSFIFVIALLTSCGLTGKAVETKKNPTVGVILPLSGFLADFGTEYKQGIEIAFDEINARNHMDIKVVFEDDQSLDAVAASKAGAKLVGVDKVDLVVTGLIEEAKPSAPLVTSAGVPMYLIWDSNEWLSSAGPLVFSNGFSTEKSGEAMADFVWTNLSIGSVAIIELEDPWSEMISNSFKQKYGTNGGKIVFDSKVPLDASDFKTLVLKAIDSGAGAIYAPLMPTQQPILYSQARELGFEGVFLAGDSFISDAISASGKDAEGSYLTNIYSDVPDEVLAAYKKRNGQEAKNPALVGIGYEAIRKIEPVLVGYPDEAIVVGLGKVFGPTRTADRVEKVFKIEAGKAVLALN